MSQAYIQEKAFPRKDQIFTGITKSTADLLNIQDPCREDAADLPREDTADLPRGNTIDHREEVADLREEVADLQEEVANLREVAELQEEVADLQEKEVDLGEEVADPREITADLYRKNESKLCREEVSRDHRVSGRFRKGADHLKNLTEGTGRRSDEADHMKEPLLIGGTSTGTILKLYICPSTICTG